MQDAITQYLTKIDHQYQTRVATEHIFRPALQQLLATMLIVLNELARQAVS